MTVDGKSGDDYCNDEMRAPDRRRPPLVGSSEIKRRIRVHKSPLGSSSIHRALGAGLLYTLWLLARSLAYCHY